MTDTWQEKLVQEIEAMPRSERMMLMLHRISECSTIEAKKLQSNPTSAGILKDLIDQGLVRYCTRPRFEKDVELTRWGHKCVLWSVGGFEE